MSDSKNIVKDPNKLFRTTIQTRSNEPRSSESSPDPKGVLQAHQETLRQLKQDYQNSKRFEFIPIIKELLIPFQQYDMIKFIQLIKNSQPIQQQLSHELKIFDKLIYNHSITQKPDNCLTITTINNLLAFTLQMLNKSQPIVNTQSIQNNTSIDFSKVSQSASRRPPSSDRKATQEKQINRLIGVINDNLQAGNYPQTRMNIQALIKRFGKEQSLQQKLTYFEHILSLSQGCQKEATRANQLASYITRLSQIDNQQTGKSSQVVKIIRRDANAYINRQSRKQHKDQPMLASFKQIEKISSLLMTLVEPVPPQTKLQTVSIEKYKELERVIIENKKSLESHQEMLNYMSNIMEKLTMGKDQFFKEFDVLKRNKRRTGQQPYMLLNKLYQFICSFKKDSTDLNTFLKSLSTIAQRKTITIENMMPQMKKHVQKYPQNELVSTVAANIQQIIVTIKEKQTNRELQALQGQIKKLRVDNQRLQKQLQQQKSKSQQSHSQPQSAQKQKQKQKATDKRQLSNTKTPDKRITQLQSSLDQLRKQYKQLKQRETQYRKQRQTSQQKREKQQKDIDRQCGQIQSNIKQRKFRLVKSAVSAFAKKYETVNSGARHVANTTLIGQLVQEIHSTQNMQKQTNKKWQQAQTEWMKHAKELQSVIDGHVHYENTVIWIMEKLQSTPKFVETELESLRKDRQKSVQPRYDALQKISSFLKQQPKVQQTPSKQPSQDKKLSRSRTRQPSETTQLQKLRRQNDRLTQLFEQQRRMVKQLQQKHVSEQTDNLEPEITELIAVLNRIQKGGQWWKFIPNNKKSDRLSAFYNLIEKYRACELLLAKNQKEKQIQINTQFLKQRNLIDGSQFIKFLRRYQSMFRKKQFMTDDSFWDQQIKQKNPQIHYKQLLLLLKLIAEQCRSKILQSHRSNQKAIKIYTDQIEKLVNVINELQKQIAQTKINEQVTTSTSSKIDVMSSSSSKLDNQDQGNRTDLRQSRKFQRSVQNQQKMKQAMQEFIEVQKRMLIQIESLTNEKQQLKNIINSSQDQLHKLEMQNIQNIQKLQERLNENQRRFLEDFKVKSEQLDYFKQTCRQLQGKIDRYEARQKQFDSIMTTQISQLQQQFSEQRNNYLTQLTKLKSSMLIQQQTPSNTFHQSGAYMTLPQQHNTLKLTSPNMKLFQDASVVQSVQFQTPNDKEDHLQAQIDQLKLRLLEFQARKNQEIKMEVRRVIEIQTQQFNEYLKQQPITNKSLLQTELINANWSQVKHLPIVQQQRQSWLFQNVLRDEQQQWQRQNEVEWAYRVQQIEQYWHNIIRLQRQAWKKQLARIIMTKDNADVAQNTDQLEEGQEIVEQEQRHVIKVSNNGTQQNGQFFQVAGGQKQQLQITTMQQLDQFKFQIQEKYEQNIIPEKLMMQQKQLNQHWTNVLAKQQNHIEQQYRQQIEDIQRKWAQLIDQEKLNRKMHSATPQVSQITQMTQTTQMIHVPQMTQITPTTQTTQTTQMPPKNDNHPTSTNSTILTQQKMIQINKTQLIAQIQNKWVQVILPQRMRQAEQANRRAVEEVEYKWSTWILPQKLKEQQAYFIKVIEQNTNKWQTVILPQRVMTLQSAYKQAIRKLQDEKNTLQNKLKEQPSYVNKSIQQTTPKQTINPPQEIHLSQSYHQQTIKKLQHQIAILSEKLVNQQNHFKQHIQDITNKYQTIILPQKLLSVQTSYTQSLHKLQNDNILLSQQLKHQQNHFNNVIQQHMIQWQNIIIPSKLKELQQIHQQTLQKLQQQKTVLYKQLKQQQTYITQTLSQHRAKLKTSIQQQSSIIFEQKYKETIQKLQLQKLKHQQEELDKAIEEDRVKWLNVFLPERLRVLQETHRQTILKLQNEKSVLATQLKKQQTHFNRILSEYKQQLARSGQIEKRSSQQTHYNNLLAEQQLQEQTIVLLDKLQHQQIVFNQLLLQTTMKWQQIILPERIAATEKVYQQTIKDIEYKWSNIILPEKLRQQQTHFVRIIAQTNANWQTVILPKQLTALQTTYRHKLNQLTNQLSSSQTYQSKQHHNIHSTIVSSSNTQSTQLYPHNILSTSNIETTKLLERIHQLQTQKENIITQIQTKWSTHILPKQLHQQQLNFKRLIDQAEQKWNNTVLVNAIKQHQKKEQQRIIQLESKWNIIMREEKLHWQAMISLRTQEIEKHWQTVVLLQKKIQWQKQYRLDIEKEIKDKYEQKLAESKTLLQQQLQTLSPKQLQILLQKQLQRQLQTTIQNEKKLWQQQKNIELTEAISQQQLTTFNYQKQLIQLQSTLAAANTQLSYLRQTILSTTTQCSHLKSINTQLTTRLTNSMSQLTLSKQQLFKYQYQCKTLQDSCLTLNKRIEKYQQNHHHPNTQPNINQTLQHLHADIQTLKQNQQTLLKTNKQLHNQLKHYHTNTLNSIHITRQQHQDQLQDNHNDMIQLEILHGINRDVSELTLANHQLQTRLMLIERKQQISKFDVKIINYFEQVQLQTELLVNYLYDLEVIGNRDAFRRFSEECMGLLANGNIKEYFHQWQMLLRGLFNDVIALKTEQLRQQAKDFFQLKGEINRILASQIQLSEREELQVIEQYKNLVDELKELIKEYIRTGDQEYLHSISRSLNIDEK